VFLHYFIAILRYSCTYIYFIYPWNLQSSCDPNIFEGLNRNGLQSVGVQWNASLVRMLVKWQQLTYSLYPLCVSKHVRPWPKCAIGFCRVLVVPGDPMSSCSSSLSPLSSSVFLSVCLSFYSHQWSTWGQLMVVLLMACATHDQSSDNNNNALFTLDETLTCTLCNILLQRKLQWDTVCALSPVTRITFTNNKNSYSLVLLKYVMRVERST